MKVLVVGEYSGIVRDAFIRHGHEAISCDLLPSESLLGEHWQEPLEWIEPDVLRSFDLAICHPPCTYLANSGVRWLYSDPRRWQRLRQGGEFFKRCLNLPIDRIAVENPIIHKYALNIIGQRSTQTIQPWMFGHGETKAVQLWLKNLPLLQPTNIVSGRIPRVHYMSPGPDRAKKRSEFFTGIAEAMAQRWGSLPPISEILAL